MDMVENGKGGKLTPDISESDIICEGMFRISCVGSLSLNGFPASSSYVLCDLVETTDALPVMELVSFLVTYMALTALSQTIQFPF